MTDPEALDIAVARTGHARFRELLDPAHPDHDPRYWEVVRGLAGGTPVPEPPGVFRKAANFAGAVARHVAAGMPVLGEEATAARLAVCEACEHKRGDSCGLCGCRLSWKARMENEHCPIHKW
jgi:hypothetical protein